MRSRVQSYEEGEKTSKFFCNLEKRKYFQKVITKVNLHENIVLESNVVLKEMRRYYKNLYSSKLSDNSNLVFFEKFKH